jgi:succinate dehydrogenase / fumarate reductase iron-sulfur subunit
MHGERVRSAGKQRERTDMANRTFKVWRGDQKGGSFQSYDTDVSEGMVVLDVLHALQASQTPDLAVRWNC